MRPAAREPAAADDRRTGILTAARRVFLRESYARASMESIAQEAGVSKQTVYNHFGSKKELFNALVRGRCESLSAELSHETDAGGDDPAKVLTAFGENVLEIMLSEESMDLYRLLQAEGRSHPGLGEIFYRQGPDRTARLIADYLAEQTRNGRLDVPDPRMAAEQFVTMLVGHLRVRHLLGIAGPPTRADRARYVNSAVRLFLDGARAR